MDLLNPLVVRVMGANINRQTVTNIGKAGLLLERVEDLGAGGIFKLVLARVPPEPVLLHLLPLLLPQVVVESEVPLHLQGRQSFSAAMARSSPPTVQPTYERAPSTRSPPNGRPCPSACLNWMPVRG